MTRVFPSMMLAALAFAASCNGTSSGTDGGGGTRGGSGGQTSGSGGATGGTGGHGTGGQGGIDNLCLSEGQGCGTLGPMCCSGLSCCYGSNGQASCLPGSCTGSQGGHGGGGAAGGGGGSGATGGAGGEGGAQACLPAGSPCSSANQCCSFICAGGCQSMIVSDRNMKRDFAPVNDGEILKAVDALPISSWSYKGDGSNSRHIGPMAQDFMSTFHVGSNDKTILQVDGDGVSLAAIKALSQRLKDLEARNELLETQVSELRARQSRSRHGDDNRRPSGAR
jgi:Chaperone of endosialidase